MGRERGLGGWGWAATALFASHPGELCGLGEAAHLCRDPEVQGCGPHPMGGCQRGASQFLGPQARLTGRSALSLLPWPAADRGSGAQTLKGCAGSWRAEAPSQPMGP